MEEKKDEILCLYCGEKNDINNSTCKKCGNQLHLKDSDGNVIDVSSKFVNDVEIIMTIIPEYRKKLLYIPKKNKRISVIEELFLQGNNRSIYEDIWLFYRIYEKNRDLKYENIKDKKYQSLDELVVFYATVLSKILLDKRTNNNSDICNKKNYEIVAYILGFSEWIDRVNKVKDDSDYDNYNCSLNENEILYLKSRINTTIDKIDNNNKNKKEKNRKRPSIITFIISIIVVVLAGIGIYFGFFTFDIEKCKDSVVLITTYDKYGTELGTGSGFCAFKEDYIVTNYHVIEGAYRIVVTTDSKTNYNVDSVVIFRKSDDLAILRIDGKLKPLKLGNLDFCRVKSKVTTIGSPKGELNTVSTGIISNMDNSKEIRITAPISHGSSGGVLLNSRGRVIGITSAGYDDAQNLNFAIPVNYLINLKNSRKYAVQLFDTTYDNSYEKKDYIYNNMFEVNVIDENKYYAAMSVSSLYYCTSDFSKYDDTISKWNGNIPNKYKKFVNDTKYSVVYHFKELAYYDNYNKLSDAIDSIDQWNVYEWLLNLNLMERWKLAIFIEDYAKINGRDPVYVVSEYFSDSVKYRITLIILGLRSVNNYSADVKSEIFNYVNGLSLKILPKGIILQKLGFNVVFNDDGTCKVYY